MENEYGGPVWHASAAPLEGWNPDKHFLRQCCFAALRGVGDAGIGQFEEFPTGFAYHVKRRLTEEEQAQIGDVIDIRGTTEADERYMAVRQYLPLHLRNWRE